MTRCTPFTSQNDTVHVRRPTPRQTNTFAVCSPSSAAHYSRPSRTLVGDVESLEVFSSRPIRALRTCAVLQSIRYTPCPLRLAPRPLRPAAPVLRTAPL